MVPLPADPRSRPPTAARSALLLASAAMLAAVALAVMGLWWSLRATRLENESRTFVEFIDGLERQNLQARSEQRLYLIQPDTANLHDFLSANAAIRASIRELQVAAGGDAERVALSQRLGTELDLLAQLRASAAAARDSGLEVASRKLSSPDYAAARTASEELLAGIRRLERARLQERHRQTHDAGFFLIGGIVLSLSLAAGLVWWALALQRRDAGLLEESEAQFRALADANPDAVLVYAEGKIVFANASAAHLMRVPSPQALVGRSTLDFLATDEARAHARERVAAIMRTGKANDSSILPVRRDDGSIVHLESRGAPIVFRGQPAIVATFRDVHDRMQTELALRESESRYRLLAENSVDLVMIRALNGRFLYVSPSFERILGWRPDELLGRDSDTLLHPDDLPAVIALDRALREGAPVASAINRLRHRDGHWITCEGVAKLQRDRAGEIEGISVSARDVSDRLMLEEQARQGQKQEALGRMAGAVAHDFNNLLTVVRASTGLLRNERLDQPSRRELLAEIDGAVDRAVGLTAQLLSVSHGHHVLPTLIAVGEMARRTFAVLSQLAGRTTATETSITPEAEAAVIRADQAQLDQVFVNLVLNARDAMPNGGKLQVHAYVATIPEPLRHHHGTLAPARYLAVRVRDTGSGITEDVMDRIFDPFFTTKPQGKGRGLGLSASLGIVQQAGGSLVVESTPGEGTTVTMYWPLADARTIPVGAVPVDAAQSTPQAPAANPRPGDVVAGNGQSALPPGTKTPHAAAPRATVAVVDDEVILVRMAKRLLEDEGYRVVTAVGGVEALALIRAEHASLSVLLVDVRMPGMGGVELVSALIHEGIDLPVLFMSGQLDAPLPATWPETVQRRFLGKPYEPDELLAAVEQLIASTAPTA